MSVKRWQSAIKKQMFGNLCGKIKPFESYHTTSLDRQLGLQEFEDPEFTDILHIKVVRLSYLGIGRLYPPGDTPGTYFCERLSRPQGQSAASMIESMKNLKDSTEEGTRDIPSCSAVTQLDGRKRICEQ
jgi:hypothetical protein